MAKAKNVKEIASDERTCTKCGKTMKENKFYMSKSSLHIDGKHTICKECTWGIYNDYYDKYEDERLAIYYTCRKLDVPYLDTAFKGVVTQATTKGNVANYFGTYRTKLNLSMVKNENIRDFDDSDKLISDDEVEKIEPIKKVVEEKSDKNDNEKLTSSNDGNSNGRNLVDEAKAKEDCLRILGYDPFDTSRPSDQVFLYSELVGYLDEDTRDDQYKVSVIIQIIQNNLQVRWCDIAINTLSEDFIMNSAKIKELANTKKELQTVNDKLAKENQIASKHRGDANSKNNTLGSQMKNLREMGFEKSEHDYYDMNKAFGMRQSLDISNKSILEIIKFDEQKQHDLFAYQRDLIKELQDKQMSLKEEIRVLLVENMELKNESIEIN